MFEIRNTATGEAGPIMSETPYALAGEYAARKEVQKRDEQGNLLYLTQTEIVDTEQYYDAEGNYIPATDPDEVLQTKTVYIETTEAYHTYEREVWDEEEQDYVVETDSAPNPPVMIDDGPVYEWVEIVPTLDELKNKKWEEVKQAREQEQYKPLIYNGFIFDFDSKSQTALSAAIQAAQASILLSAELPPIEWTLADNTKKIMTADALIQLLFLGISRTNSIFSYARTLREQIDLAENKEDLNLVIWNYGVE